MSSVAKSRHTKWMCNVSRMRVVTLIRFLPFSFLTPLKFPLSLSLSLPSIFCLGQFLIVISKSLGACHRKWYHGRILHLYLSFRGCFGYELINTSGVVIKSKHGRNMMFIVERHACVSCPQVVIGSPLRILFLNIRRRVALITRC